MTGDGPKRSMVEGDGLSWWPAAVCAVFGRWPAGGVAVVEIVDPEADAGGRGRRGPAAWFAATTGAVSGAIAGRLDEQGQAGVRWFGGATAGPDRPTWGGCRSLRARVSSPRRVVFRRGRTPGAVTREHRPADACDGHGGGVLARWSLVAVFGRGAAGGVSTARPPPPAVVAAVAGTAAARGPSPPWCL